MRGVCLVVGGTNSLGRACAEHVALRGYVTVVAGRDQTRGVEVVESIKSKGGDAHLLLCDVTSRAAVQELVEKTVAIHSRLDAAINASGIIGPTAPLHTLVPDLVEKVWQTNFLGNFYCMQEEIKAMLPQGHGHIVNFTSIYGLHGQALVSPYVASKHAIAGITKAAALEYGQYNIFVNAVAPGVVPTDMITELGRSLEGLLGKDTAMAIQQDTTKDYPIGRLGTPDDVAKAVLYLIESEWTTGTILEIDGGCGAK